MKLINYSFVVTSNKTEHVDKIGDVVNTNCKCFRKTDQQ
jgi:hypothetical protein